METFSALLAICAGNSPVPCEFPAQRPMTRTFDVFFYLRLNKRFSKQSWGWWFETLSRPLWRHCNAFLCLPYAIFVNTIHKNDILRSNSNCIMEHIICKYTYLLILIWYDFWGAALLERHLEITAQYKLIPIQSRCSNISRDIRRAFWNVNLINFINGTCGIRAICVRPVLSLLVPNSGGIWSNTSRVKHWSGRDKIKCFPKLRDYNVRERRRCKFVA